MLTTTKRLLMRCIATLCVATVFLVRAEDVDAPIATQLAKLVANDGAANDQLGQSIAISDGIAVVGARQDDDKGSSSGSAYVFEMISSGNSSSWAQVAKLTADDGAANDRLGMSVAISDGIIVVGAPFDDNKKGSAYVFKMSSSDDSSSWEQVAKLTVGSAGDNFGTSVTISDGTLVVGAHCDDDKGSNSGSAYLFQMSSPGNASSFTQVAKLTADDGAKDDWFGISVGIGVGTIVVGALHDADNGFKSGSAYIFEMSSPGDASSCTQVAKLTADDGGFKNHFGRNIAISDGTAIVSAHGDSGYKGSAYIFQMKNEPPPPSPPPSPPPPPTVYTTTFEDRTFTTTVVKQDDGTFKESVSSSPLSALGLAPGGSTFPRVSAVVAVVSVVALLASVAVRRARETNVDHRQEGEVLLNSNKYGAVNA